ASSDSSMLSTLAGGPKPDLVRSELSIAHPIDSFNEIMEKIEEWATPSKPREVSNVGTERAAVYEMADQKIKDPAELKKFQDSIETFEERAKRDGLSDAEKAKFYYQISKLLDAKDSDNPDLPKEKDRIVLAEQLMSNAANPTGIDQGNHNTCGAAALEAQLLSTNPSEAAKLIVDVATTGEYPTKDGRTIKPDASTLRPEDGSTQVPSKGGERGYASQLFQATAVTTAYPEYHQEQAVSGRKPPDTGERIRIPNPDRLSEKIDRDFPGLTPQEVQNLNKAITGDDVPIIENSRTNADDGQIHVRDEADMKRTLAELQRQGKLPAIIFVDSQNPPFYEDSGGSTAGGSGDHHFVRVTSYDQKTGTVSIDNQWGSKSDRKSMPVGQLYQATEKANPFVKIL